MSAPERTEADDVIERLDALLRAESGALVSAMSPDGRLTEVPAQLRLHGQETFSGRSAMGFFVEDDRAAVVDAWATATRQSVVSTTVRVATDPDRNSTLHFFDLRPSHGVHVVVLETADPRALLGTSPTLDATRNLVGRVRRDAASVFLDVDDATTAILGWTREELVGRRTTDILHPDDAETAVRSWLAMRALGAEDVRSTVRFRHRDGHHVWLEVTNTNRLDDPGFGCVLSSIVDVSDRMLALEELRQRERLLQRLAETVPIGICHLRPDGEVAHANPPLLELLGPVADLDGLLGVITPTDRAVVQIALDRANEGRPVDLEVGVIHPDGERRCELTFRAMTTEAGGIDGVVVCATDVTDRSRLRAELEHRASHDELSGCLNRAATIAALERTLRTHVQVMVAYIDVDQFKTVNDRFGHAAGDELLRVAAARLRHVVRAHDIVGRIGGDEFVVVCPQTGASFDDPDRLAARLSDTVCGDVSFARQRIPLRASIGVATSWRDEADAEALLSRADTAMYAAKRRSRPVETRPESVPPSA